MAKNINEQRQDLLKRLLALKPSEGAKKRVAAAIKANERRNEQLERSMKVSVEVLRRQITV